MENLSKLLSEGMQLKARIDADKARLAEINREIESIAVFPDGKATAHVAAGGFRATVQRKTAVRWDQQKLAEAMDAIGQDAFRKVFGWEFKPLGAKQLKAFYEFGDPSQVAAVKAAMTETPASPSVKFECVLEDDNGSY